MKNVKEWRPQYHLRLSLQWHLQSWSQWPECLPSHWKHSASSYVSQRLGGSLAWWALHAISQPRTLPASSLSGKCWPCPQEIPLHLSAAHPVGEKQHLTETGPYDPCVFSCFFYFFGQSHGWIWRRYTGIKSKTVSSFHLTINPWLSEAEKGLCMETSYLLLLMTWESSQPLL